MNERKESLPQDVSFAKLAETSPVAITKVDKNGKIVYANSKAEEVLGLEKNEITDRTYNDPDWKITDFEGNDYPTEELPFELVKETGNPVYEVEHAIEWPDGERKLLSVNATPLFDEDSEFNGMVAVIEDITERRQTEHALKASEKRYRRLFETAQDGMLILNADTGEIIDANPYIQDLLGFSKQELVDKQLWQIGTFQDVVENKDKFQELVEEGFIRYEHLPLKTKSGGEASVEFVSNTYMVDSQKIVQCNIRDITERKRLEEKREELIYDLGERHKELNLLYEVTQLAVEKDNTLEDILTETVDLIPPAWQYPEITCARITYKGDEYKTKGFKETQWGQTRDIVVEDQKVGTVEVYYLEERPEADEGPFLDEEKDLIDSLGHTLGQIISHRQVEQRKEHLNSVLRSIRDVNQLLVKENDRDKLIEGICDILVEGRGYHNVWIALFDEDEKLIVSSQKGLGDSFEPMLERLEDGNLPETTKQALDQPGVLVTTEPQTNCSDYPLSKSYEDRGGLTARLAYQGKVYGVITASTPRRYAEDEEEQGLFEEVAADIAFGLHDIEVENDLKKREAQLTRSQQLAKVGSWRIDLETGSLDWSEETYRIFDVPVNESLTYDEFLEFIHPEDREYVNEEWNEALENDKEYEVEHRIVVNGDIKWVKEKAGVIRNQQREPREVVGSVQDITEYKETERELRENETKFKSIFSQSPIGIELYNQEGRLLEANQACLDLFGVKEVSEVKDFQLFEDPNLPDSAKEKLESGEQIDYETTFDFDKVRENDLYDTKKEGKSEIHVTATPITAPADIPFGGYLVQIQDITNLRKQEQQLRQSFIELAETTSRVLGVRDPYTQKHEQRVAELAREVGERMGLSEEKLLGLYIGGVLHDIGKIAIPETILTKPGELKDVEWQMIKSHPEVGYNQILEDTDFPWPVAEMTLHHHERLDGSGYPDGLEGDELTTEVRILGAVDVVEAMSTRRPYRESRSKERTLKVIKEGNGSKFGPEVVDILVDMIEEGEIDFG